MRILFLLFSLIIISCSSNKSIEDVRFEQLIISEENGVITFDTSQYEDRAKSFLISGSLFQQQGEYARSILEFQDALSYDSSAAIEYAIAQSYLELGYFQNSKQHLIRSFEINPNFHQSLDLLTEIYLYENNAEKAKITNDLALKIKETQQRLVTKAILLEDRYPEKALEIYNSIDSPNYTTLIRERKIELYKKTNKLDKLISELEKQLRNEPFNNMISREIFSIYVENNQLDKALDYTNVVDTLFYGSEQETYYVLLGSRIVSKPTIDSSIAKKYIYKINGSLAFNPEILYYSGLISSRIGNSEKRDYFFNRLLKIEESNSDLKLGIAEVYNFDREFEKSLSILDNIDKDSLNENLYYFLLKGMNLSNLKEYDQAISSYLNILEKDSSYNNYITLTLIGESYDLQNKSDSALYYYELHYSYDNDNTFLLNNYAYSLSKIGKDLDKALAMSEKTLKQDPDNSAYLDTYGWIHYKLGNTDKAIEYIEKAIDIGGVSAEVYEHLGDIYLKRGNKETAIKYFERALELEENRFKLEEKLNKEK
ncbi:MAG: tetratricopeptide repeat protein [Chlorobiota bacterium]